MVRCHGRYLGIIHGKDLTIPIEAHTADAELTGINKAPPLANMTPHPATRECLIEHRLPFHPLLLYHYGLSPHIASRPLSSSVTRTDPTYSAKFQSGREISKY
jgi:hypothetical protein